MGVEMCWGQRWGEGCVGDRDGGRDVLGTEMGVGMCWGQRWG